MKYQVLAHFEWNENRTNLQSDRNENKHHNIARRSIEKGGRRDVFLGTRECQAYVESCKFGSGEGFYDDYGELNFGLCFMVLIILTKIRTKEDEHHLVILMFDLELYYEGWNYSFPTPDDGLIKRRTVFENQPIKEFIIGQNICSVDNEGGDE